MNNTKYQIHNISCRAFLSFFLFGFLMLLLLFAPQHASAACANVPIGGDYTVSDNCIFATDGVSGVYGVDNGGITINEGATLTVGANHTVAWSPGSSLVINGSIAINDTGQLKQGFIYYEDNDSDGYPVTSTPLVQSTTPGVGYVQRNDFSTFTYTDDFTFDYDDNSTSTYPGVRCATCKTNQSDGTCAAVTDGTDPWFDCSTLTCTDYIYGWSGLNCAKYSGSSDHNGDCNGSGACYTTVADSCTGVGVTAASCGSAGCKMACATSSVATSYDTVAEMCYTSEQHGCGTEENCDDTGTCAGHDQGGGS